MPDSPDEIRIPLAGRNVKVSSHVEGTIVRIKFGTAFKSVNGGAEYLKSLLLQRFKADARFSQCNIREISVNSDQAGEPLELGVQIGNTRPDAMPAIRELLEQVNREIPDTAQLTQLAAHHQAQIKSADAAHTGAVAAQKVEPLVAAAEDYFRTAKGVTLNDTERTALSQVMQRAFTRATGQGM
jgi:hypothetical protein